MKNIDLFQAAYEIAGRSIASPAETERMVQSRYGIGRKSPGINAGFPTDQLIQLIKSAHEKSLEFIRPDKVFHDPVDDIVKEQFGFDKRSLLTAKHPLDEAFEIFAAAIKKASDEASREKTRAAELRNSHKPDEIQDFADRNFAFTDRCFESNSELIRLIDSIYMFYCPGSEINIDMDPVNKKIAETYGTGRYHVEPSHKLSEWKALITEGTGVDPNSDSNIIALVLSGDPVNEFVAAKMGLESPAARAIPILEKRIFDATHAYNYKLTPGSTEYINKGKELIRLKNDLLRLKEKEKASLGSPYQEGQKTI